MLRSLARSLPITILGLAIGVAVGLSVLRAHGCRLISVQTGSMAPVMQPGDAIVVVPARPGAIRPGEVVSYRSPRNPKLIISHRLVQIDRRTGRLTTAGDALGTRDPPFPPSLLVGQVTAVAPQLGRVLDAVRSPIGLIMTVYVPAAAIIIGEAGRLVHAYTRPLYSVRLEP